MSTLAEALANAGPREAGRARPSPTRFWAHVFIAVTLVVWSASLVVGFRWALAALMVVGFAAAVAGLFRPHLGLLGVGILCTIDAPARIFLLTGGIWRRNTFNYFLLVVLFVFLPLITGWRDAHTRILQLLVVVLGIGLVISPDLMLGIQHILGIVSVFGLGLYFFRAQGDRAVSYWMAVVCGATSVLGSLVFMLQRSALPYINPNAFAFFPLTGLFAISLGFPYAVARSRGEVTRLAF